MEFLIKPPAGSSEKPFVKEFDSREAMEQWLLEKNDEIWEADPATEKVNFPIKEIM